MQSLNSPQKSPLPIGGLPVNCCGPAGSPGPLGSIATLSAFNHHKVRECFNENKLIIKQCNPHRFTITLYIVVKTLDVARKLNHAVHLHYIITKDLQKCMHNVNVSLNLILTFICECTVQFVSCLHSNYLLCYLLNNSSIYIALQFQGK